jgi:hypothetical protein
MSAPGHTRRHLDHKRKTEGNQDGPPNKKLRSTPQGKSFEARVANTKRKKYQRTGPLRTTV